MCAKKPKQQTITGRANAQPRQRNNNHNTKNNKKNTFFRTPPTTPTKCF